MKTNRSTARNFSKKKLVGEKSTLHKVVSSPVYAVRLVFD